MVALYGGPFLEGFHVDGAPEFERWVDRRRDQYLAWTAAALESLARSAAARADHVAAAEHWQRLVVTDPLNTRLVLELMSALAAGGNLAGALRQGQAHEELLREELGAAPGPALGELVARLRAGQPAATAEPVHRPLAVSERLEDRLARDLADRYLIEPGETVRAVGIRLFPAYDRRHDRRVMLKLMDPAVASQLDVQRFVREVRLTGKLLHPHILPLLDSGEIAGRPWFSIPHPEGETLRERLGRAGALATAEAVRVALELADALGYAHRHGVVHRDVSPENVVLAGGHALVTNLGVARALDTAGGAGLTDTGALVGSVAYMSPEQADGSGAVDGRTDIYALGAVLFEMLTGDPLFSGPTPQAIMAKRAAMTGLEPSRLTGIPTGVASVLRRALERDPSGRYRSMEDLALALAKTMSEPSWRGWSWQGLVAAYRSWLKET